MQRLIFHMPATPAHKGFHFPLWIKSSLIALVSIVVLVFASNSLNKSAVPAAAVQQINKQVSVAGAQLELAYADLWEGSKMIVATAPAKGTQAFFEQLRLEWNKRFDFSRVNFKIEIGHQFGFGLLYMFYGAVGILLLVAIRRQLQP